MIIQNIFVKPNRNLQSLVPFMIHTSNKWIVFHLNTSVKTIPPVRLISTIKNNFPKVIHLTPLLVSLKDSNYSKRLRL